jgi:hypothetical protein
LANKRLARSELARRQGAHHLQPFIRRTHMKSTLLVAALAALLGTALPASAGQDESQRQMIQRTMQAKQKLQQAQAAHGTQRQALMGEHMKMMQDIMDKMTAMKPRAGMSMAEHEEWINEHQKLMGQVMEQMSTQHDMMMHCQ